MTTAPLGITPFVPAGDDWAKSRELFHRLGFCEQMVHPRYVRMDSALARFMLCNEQAPRAAERMFMKLEVASLPSWYQWVSSLQLSREFPGFVLKPPLDLPWGWNAHFFELGGVCWFVGQRDS